MTLLKFKDIDVNNLIIYKPEKVDGEYVSHIVYLHDGHEQPLLIQTPELQVGKDGKVVNIEFSMVNNGDFFCLLDNLTQHIINYIYIHSKEFFNGKEFSEQRITNSLKKIVQVDNEGHVKLNADFGITFKVFNIFNEEINDYSFPLHGKCIIDIRKIRYDKKDFIVSIHLRSIKQSAKKLKKGSIELEEEFEEELETIKEIEQQELETIKENVDDLEFF